MKKRWFVVILTIGLLLCVMPLSALALSSDPITDSDGNIIGWEDLSTDLYSFDVSDVSLEQTPVVSQEQTPVVVAPAPHAASGPAETDPVKGAAAAYRSSTNGVAEDAAVHDPNADESVPDLYEDPTDSATGTGSDQDACAIGDQTYATLTEAIDHAADGAQIKLLKDIELTEGLRFENKKLTISGGGTRTLTLEQYGMYAYKSDITFQDLTLTISAITHTYEGGAGGTANLISNSDLHLNNVDFTLTPDGSCGSGMYLYQQSNLYLDGSRVLISGNMVDGIFADESEYVGMPNREVKIMNGSYVEARGCSHAGLLLDPMDITMSSSEVFVTDNGVGYSFGFACYDGKLTMESSILRAVDNAHAWSGSGIYVGALDMDAASTIYATDNGGSGLTIGAADGKEKSYIRGQIYCTGNGTSGIGGGGGFNVHAQHDYYEDEDKWYIYEGDVTLEPGAYIYACNNKALAGVLNNWILNIESGATVIADSNEQLGFANSFDARTTIESGANVSVNNNLHGIYNYAGGGDLAWATGFFLIEGGANVTANNNKQFGIYNSGDSKTPTNDHFTIQSGADVSADGNGAHGIYNDGGIFTVETGATVSACNNSYYGIFNNKGTFTVENGVDLQVEYNQESGVVNVENSKLTLLSGRVRYNTTKNFYGYGGGLRNYGEATLSDDVQLYNNHAVTAGDDIYNSADATITFGPTGSDWALDGGPDCYHPIDGWYDDSVDTRWNAHEDEAGLHMVLTQPGTYSGYLALKAAHGPTGSLIVHKQTTGEQLVDDCDAVFTFVLTLDDENINTVNDERYGVRFENGKATFTLKDGESKAIENLPVRMGYTITEQSKGGWLLARVDGDAEGKVPYRATAEIAFVNEKQTATGSLVVTKELAGELDADDADTVFNFMLMLDDNTITTADAEEYGVQFENGIASFSLKGGESITIANLPAGVGYTIAEVRQTGWTLQSVSGADTGVVPKNDTAEIVFTNLKNGTDIPDVPVVPTEPEEPTEPETPETPEEPAEPDAPAQDETPGEEPAQDDTTVPAQPAETPAQDTTKADTLPQTGTTGWLAVVLMSFGFGLLACGWFFTRKQRAAKH